MILDQLTDISFSGTFYNTMELVSLEQQEVLYITDCQLYIYIYIYILHVAIKFDYVNTSRIRESLVK